MEPYPQSLWSYSPTKVCLLRELFEQNISGRLRLTLLTDTVECWLSWIHKTISMLFKTTYRHRDIGLWHRHSRENFAPLHADIIQKCLSQPLHWLSSYQESEYSSPRTTGLKIYITCLSKENSTDLGCHFVQTFRKNEFRLLKSGQAGLVYSTTMGLKLWWEATA